MQVPITDNQDVTGTPRQLVNPGGGGGTLHIKNTGSADVYVGAMADLSFWSIGVAWKLEPGETVDMPDYDYGHGGNVVAVSTSGAGVTSTIAIIATY